MDQGQPFDQGTERLDLQSEGADAGQRGGRNAAQREDVKGGRGDLRIMMREKQREVGDGKKHAEEEKRHHADDPVQDDGEGHRRPPLRNRPRGVENLDDIPPGGADAHGAEKLSDHGQFEDAPKAEMDAVDAEQHAPAPGNDEQDGGEAEKPRRDPGGVHGADVNPDQPPVDDSHQPGDDQHRDQRLQNQPEAAT